VARLPETLKHLAWQILPSSIPWEVIVVVDKDSTDDTATVAARVWQEAGAPASLLVLVEARPGRSFALETGFIAAKYCVVVTVDDDNWLNPDYLERAFHLMCQHPEVGAAGGKITAAFEAKPPDWFPQFQTCFAIGPQGKASGDITSYKRHVAGAGMVVRKSAYQCLKQLGFRPVLSGGRRGNLTAGEDLELCYALVLAGYRIWYDENLRLTHFMPKGRITTNNLLEMSRRNRIAGPIQAGYEAALNGGNISVLKFYLRRVLQLGSWLLKGAMKFLLRKQSWLSLRIAFGDWFQSLYDYGALNRTLRVELPRINRLKENQPVFQ
jgi:glycosyltransferase involved in cell wall biosynthesis